MEGAEIFETLTYKLKLYLVPFIIDIDCNLTFRRNDFREGEQLTANLSAQLRNYTIKRDRERLENRKPVWFRVLSKSATVVVVLITGHDEQNNTNDPTRRIFYIKLQSFSTFSIFFVFSFRAVNPQTVRTRARFRTTERSTIWNARFPGKVSIIVFFLTTI